MRKLKINQLKELIKHVVIRNNKPVFIRGRFGIGKSAGANECVMELNSRQAMADLLGDKAGQWVTNAQGEQTFIEYVGCEIIDVRLGQYDSVDMRGFAHIDRESATAVWYPPATMPFVGNDSFRDDILYLLFLDEFTSASTAVFAVCYQLILDRCVGEHVLKPNVRIALAGNLDDDRGVVNKVPMPLNNRMIHVEAVNPLDDFCFYAQKAGVPPVFIAFWKFKETLVNTYDPKKIETVVATQRSWFMAVDIWNDDKMPHEIKEAAMVGAVGEGPTVEFSTFVDIWRSLTPIKDIIADPEGVALPKEPSLKYAMSMHVSGNMNAKTVDALHKFMTRMSPEFAVMAWQLAVERDESLFSSKAFLDYSKRYRDVYTN